MSVTGRSDSLTLGCAAGFPNVSPSSIKSGVFNLVLSGHCVMQITNERDLDHTPPPEIRVESEAGRRHAASSISATGGENFSSSGLTWVISPVSLWEKAHLRLSVRLMHFATHLPTTTNSLQSSHL
jgi:hypothetical protein